MASFLTNLKNEIVHAVILFGTTLLAAVLALGANHLGWKAVIGAVVAAAHVVWSYVRSLINPPAPAPAPASK